MDSSHPIQVVAVTGGKGGVGKTNVCVNLGLALSQLERRVTLLDADGNPVEIVKARDLAGKPDLLFRRNSTTGTVECLTNRSTVELNEELHAHN